MTKRQLAKLVYLTGGKFGGYDVKTSGFDGAIDMYVTSYRVGNAIVRAIRDEAAKRPDLFPPSAVERVKGAR